MNLDYDYPDFPCVNQSIDALDIDLECITQMKNLGMRYIGDILEDWERVRDVFIGSPKFRWECRVATYLYLAEIGCWP
jgi:hypothetical protein